MSDNAKYLEIADKIKQKIITNIYKPNELLPSEKQLYLEYNVSRRTIRHSITKLVEDGFLYTVPGKGTFVHVRANNKYSIDLDIHSILPGGYDTASLYSAKIIKPDIYDVYYLRVAPNEKVICIKWVLRRQDRVVAYDIKTIPYFSGVPIGESDLGYTCLRDILVTKFSQFELKEEVSLTAEEPNEELREVMELAPDENAPMICLNINVFDNDMMPLGRNILYIRAEECEFRGELEN